MTETEQRPRMSKKRIITIIAVVVIIVAAIYVFYDFNGKSLDLSNRSVKQVMTDSMEGDPQPFEIKTISTDDLIMIKTIPAENAFNEIKVGDVLAFYQWNTLYVHRVVAIDPVAHTFTTRGDKYVSGDNTLENDPSLGYTETVYQHNVFGKVIGVSGWMGSVAKVMKTPVGLAIVGIIILGVAALTVRDMFVQKK